MFKHKFNMNENKLYNVYFCLKCDMCFCYECLTNKVYKHSFQKQFIYDNWIFGLRDNILNTRNAEIINSCSPCYLSDDEYIIKNIIE